MDRTDVQCRTPAIGRIMVGIAVALASVLIALPASAHADGKLLVFTGKNAKASGFTLFAQASGRTLEESGTLPSLNADWDQYQCVVLPMPQSAFTLPETVGLTNYIARGGTVLALAEMPLQPLYWGVNATAALNPIASQYGMVAGNVEVNTTGTLTTNITPSRFTTGVNTVSFAGTTLIQIVQGGGAIALANTVQFDQNTDPPPSPFIALRESGTNGGKFVYSGDPAPFVDLPNRYIGSDNGRLANNICGDTTPPAITITTPVEAKRYPRGAVVDGLWGCTDGDSGLDTIAFTNGGIPGNTFGGTPITGNTFSGVPIDTTGPVGQSIAKEFIATCTDKAGNVGQKKVNYIVDGSPPQPVIDVPVEAETYNRNSAVANAWHCDDNDGPTDIATQTYTNGGLTGSASGAALDTVMPGGPPVQKSFTVTCTDKAGNTGTKTVSYTVEDQNDPVPTITTPGDKARFTVNEPVTADWLCTDPDDRPGVPDINPDENVTFGTTPDNTPLDTSGSEGQSITKPFTVVCTDFAGNTGSKTNSYVVDGNPPVVTITVPGDGAQYKRGSSQPANWGCTDPDEPVDVVTKVGTLPVGTPVNTGTLGPKSFKVTCTDLAGNVSEKTVGYTVIGGPPDITIKTPVQGATYDQGAVVNPSYSCSDPDGDLKSCLREGGTGALDTSKGGPGKFTVNAADLAGNTATKTITYTVKAKPGATANVSPTGKASPTAKVCKSRRQFRIRVKKLRGGVSAVSATVFVNGKKTLTRKGKRITATVTLKGLKKGTYRVKISVRYSNGRVLTYTRKFKTCTPKGK